MPNCKNKNWTTYTQKKRKENSWPCCSFFILLYRVFVINWRPHAKLPKQFFVVVVSFIYNEPLAFPFQLNIKQIDIPRTCISFHSNGPALSMAYRYNQHISTVSRSSSFFFLIFQELIIIWFYFLNSIQSFILFYFVCFCIASSLTQDTRERRARHVVSFSILFWPLSLISYTYSTYTHNSLGFIYYNIIFFNVQFSILCQQHCSGHEVGRALSHDRPGPNKRVRAPLQNISPFDYYIILFCVSSSITC